MLNKSFFVTIIAICIAGVAYAQPKTMLLNKANAAEGSLSIFPVNELVQPSGTAVLLNSNLPPNAPALVNLTDALTKRGVSVFRPVVTGNALTKPQVMQAIEQIKAADAGLNINPAKVGVISYNTSIDAGTNYGNVAFWAILKPVQLTLLNQAANVNLLLSVDGYQKSAFDIYNKRLKSGNNTSLFIHGQSTADSTYTAETINWLANSGLLQPVSNEKTNALKTKENWANFAKSIEDRIHNDWAWLKRYEGDNANTPPPAAADKRVVFMGNSITEGWISQDPDFFKTNHYINRGIGGQTTPQMLVRFREDVIDLKPKVVVILAGINDIAENTGPSKLENIAGNIMSMAELARAHNIKVILCTVLPAKSFPWKPNINPVPSIIKLNGMLKAYAEANKLSFVDYYTATVDSNQAFKKEWASDGVHPNLAGYKIMEPLVKQAIDKALLK